MADLAIKQCSLCGLVYRHGDGYDGYESQIIAYCTVNNVYTAISQTAICYTCAAALKAAIDAEIVTLTDGQTGVSAAEAQAAVPYGE